METAIQLEVKRLLDRLYNFKGNNSEIITQIDSEIAALAEAKNELINKAEANKNALDEIAHKKAILEKEYAYFEKAISPINSESVKTLFDELGIVVDFNEVKAQIETRFPETKEKLETQVNDLNEETTDYSSKIKGIEDHKAEVEIKRMEALKNQKSLAELLEKVFNGNEDISKQSIKGLLRLFNFTEEECDELAKTLLFPEDTLFVYDQIINQAPGRSVVDIVRTAKTATEGVIIEGNEPEDRKYSFDFDDKPVTTVVNNKLDLIFDLLGFDLNQFTKEQRAQLEELPNKDILTTNFELINAMNLSPIESFSLLIDNNLKFKVQQLLDLNKNYKDIKNCLGVLAIDVNTMQKNFDLLGNHGFDLRKIPLIVYVHGPQTYIDNIDILNKYGYNIDDKQFYNNAVDLLIDSALLTANLQIIKEYSINITNSEGKIYLKLLALDSNKLEQNAKQFIEAGIEHIIDQDPMVLANDAGEIIARITYCQENGIPYQTNGLNNDYLSFVFHQSEFEQVLQKPVDITSYKVVADQPETFGGMGL